MAGEDFHFINRPEEKSSDELQKEQEEKLADAEYQEELKRLWDDSNNGEEDDRYSWQRRHN